MMEILVSLVFFLFLGCLAVWIFSGLNSELSNYRGYWRRYHNGLRSWLLADEPLLGSKALRQINTEIMPVMMATSYIMIAGPLFIFFAFSSMVGLTLTVIQLVRVF